MSQDKFESEIKSKLKDFTTHKDADIWAKLESEILRRKRIVLVRQISAIAAVLVLFMVLGISLNRPHRMGETYQAMLATPNVEISIVDELLEIQGLREFREPRVIKEGTRETNVMEVMGQEVVEREVVEQKKESEEDADEIQNVEDSSEENGESADPKVGDDVEEIDEFWNDTNYYFDQESSSSHSPQVSLGVRSSGAIGSSNSIVPRALDMASGTDRPLLDDIGKTQIDSDFENYHTSYKMPVSVGLSLDISLSKNFSIRTGIQAKHLAMEFRNKRLSDDAVATSNSWYLGIPANLVWSFYNGKYFASYLSVGALGEKAVSISQTGDDIIFDKSSNIKLSELKVKDLPLQFSANASLGIQYNIIDQLSIYFEPGLSYYIDNKYYFGKKYSFNMNAGIRFNTAFFRK